MTFWLKINEVIKKLINTLVKHIHINNYIQITKAILIKWTHLNKVRNIEAIN